MLNKLEMLKIFCAAAEAKTFKQAAIRLGISPQAVTRAIRTLEAELGEVLFFRNTRQNQITPYGLTLAQRARMGLQQIDDLFAPNEAQTQAISGLVRVAAPNAMVLSHLPALVAELMAQHPALQIELQFSDEISDVVAQQIDIGIRVGWMRDSQLVARVVSQCPFYIVATPSVIERYGMPMQLETLNDRPSIVVLDGKTGRPWPWFLNDGATWLPRQPVLATNNSVYEFHAVMAGCGFGQLAGFLAQPHLKSGALVQVLPEIQPTPWNVYVYRANRTPVPARVRLVYDWLAQGLADGQQFPAAPQALAVM